MPASCEISGAVLMTMSASRAAASTLSYSPKWPMRVLTRGYFVTRRLPLSSSRTRTETCRLSSVCCSSSLWRTAPPTWPVPPTLFQVSQSLLDTKATTLVRTYKRIFGMLSSVYWSRCEILTGVTMKQSPSKPADGQGEISACKVAVGPC